MTPNQIWIEGMKREEAALFFLSFFFLFFSFFFSVSMAKRWKVQKRVLQCEDIAVIRSMVKIPRDVSGGGGGGWWVGERTVAGGSRR